MYMEDDRTPLERIGGLDGNLNPSGDGEMKNVPPENATQDVGHGANEEWSVESDDLLQKPRPGKGCGELSPQASIGREPPLPQEELPPFPVNRRAEQCPDGPCVPADAGAFLKGVPATSSVPAASATPSHPAKELDARQTGGQWKNEGSEDEPLPRYGIRPDAPLSENGPMNSDLPDGQVSGVHTSETKDPYRCRCHGCPLRLLCGRCRGTSAPSADPASGPANGPAKGPVAAQAAGGQGGSARKK